MVKRYNDLNTYLKNIFGCRVQKITIDAGLSCPNRDGKLSTKGCIFCNAKGSGNGAYDKGLTITDQLIKGKAALFKRYKAKKFIAYFQSFSNTYASFERLKSLYEEALSVDDIVGLAIGTRPDCVDEPILQLLQSYTKNYLIWLEYGLQSVHDKTLTFINRGHNFQCFKRAVAATKNRGIKICAHVILGLPYEKRSHMLQTANDLAKMGIDGIKLHLLYVVKATALENLYARGEYNCLGQQQYVNLVCDFLERIPQDIVIQRLTGDPHPNELVAPAWSLKKTETLALIKDTLEKRNSWQGKSAFTEQG
ncbi:MAG: TIGR01212 family radical SAM protein [Desulfobacterales bacterium]|nr:TIGR01212 family radical SAM protein [Desulfobacterales bacterium]